MFPDSFHKTMQEAMEEVARRRADPQGKEIVTRIQSSPYGGFRVRSLPADLYVDMLADGQLLVAADARRQREELAD
jgi:hypothetical protein